MTTETKKEAETRKEDAAEAKRAEKEDDGGAAEAKRAVLDVELRDDSDSTVDAMEALIGRLGGRVKAAKGRHWKVECPRGTDRDPTNRQTTFVQHLRNDPLVAEVDHG